MSSWFFSWTWEFALLQCNILHKTFLIWPHLAAFIQTVAAAYDVQFCHFKFGRSTPVINFNTSKFKGRNNVLLKRPLVSKMNQKSFDCFSNQCQNSRMNVKATSEQCLDLETFSQESNDGDAFLTSSNGTNFDIWKPKSRAFRNRFLNLVRLRSVLNNAAESFFKSEIRRRLFVTAVLIVISRVGYFIPLPGFDRRLIPQDYLSFVSGSAGEFLKFYACVSDLYILIVAEFNFVSLSLSHIHVRGRWTRWFYYRDENVFFPAGHQSSDYSINHHAGLSLFFISFFNVLILMWRLRYPK